MDSQACAGEAVVCVHGIWMTGHEHLLLRRWLRRSGYRTYRFRYPSVLGDPAANVQRLRRFVAGLDEPVVHFLGHSLGGRLILEMMDRDPPPQPGHVVCLGTPCNGSYAAAWLDRWPLARWLLGRARPVLVHGYGRWEGERAVGVIAGNRGFGPGRVLPGFRGPSDGTVAVGETRLPGADHLELPVSHTGFLLSRRAAEQTCQFFDTGTFQAPWAK